MRLVTLLAAISSKRTAITMSIWSARTSCGLTDDWLLRP
jgi:hypothetical protein